jgi:hypothetical protein
VKLEPQAEAIIHLLMEILRRPGMFELWDDALTAMVFLIQQCPSSRLINPGPVFDILEKVMLSGSPSTMGLTATVIGSWFQHEPNMISVDVRVPLQFLMKLIDDPSVGAKTRHYSQVVAAVAMILEGLDLHFPVAERDQYAHRLHALGQIPVDIESLADLEGAAALFEAVAVGYARLIRVLHRYDPSGRLIRTTYTKPICAFCRNVQRSMAHDEATLSSIYDMLGTLATVVGRQINVQLQSESIKLLLKAGQQKRKGRVHLARTAENLERLLHNL